jgi:hypothetical protein
MSNSPATASDQFRARQPPPALGGAQSPTGAQDAALRSPTESAEQLELEKQRCTLLLEINRDLLGEAMRLKANKEAAAGGDGSTAKAPDENYLEYVHHLLKVTNGSDACAASNPT